MGNIRFSGLVVLACAVLVTGSCANRTELTGDIPDSQGWHSIPAPPSITPPALALPNISSGIAAYEVDPAGFIASHNASFYDWDGADITQLLPSETGGIAWAMYSFNIPPGERFMGLFLDVDDIDLDDENRDPPHSYFVGFANYQENRWEWQGPFSNSSESVGVKPGFPREAHLNSSGAAVWIIVSYCPAEETPQTTSIWAMDCVTSS